MTATDTDLVDIDTMTGSLRPWPVVTMTCCRDWPVVLGYPVGYCKLCGQRPTR